ncbi:MAG: M3 family metallopeptidase [Bacteroidales bacterium]|nr:M3 family metallopeptidase [Bacteroidales bacterium]
MRKILLTVAIAITMTVSAANPFFGKYKTPHGTIPFSEIKTEHYMPAFKEGIKRHQQEIDVIVNNRAIPDFENTIEALDNSGEMLAKVASVFFNLLSAECSDELMELSQKIQPMLSEHSNNIQLNSLLFNKVKEVYENQDKFNLNEEQKMLLKNTYLGFEASGATLNEKDKETYRTLSLKEDSLSLVFGQNALKATNAFEMILTKEDELTGLPESFKEACALAAKNKNKEGYLITLSATSYVPFMKYSSRRDLREKLYKAYNSRCVGGEFDNVENMRQIANTRLETAKLMGKDNYAQKALENRMAKNEQGVNGLLNQLLEAYKPVALQEVKEIQGYAIGKENENIELMPWDFGYYSEKLKNAKYSINDEMLKPYFPLENVKKGVFGLATKLYGITFKKNTKIQTYHPEVEAFEVFDKDGKFLAVLYTDFHPREGKRAGAWMNDFKGQWKENGKDSRPHITIVMNFTRPTADKPALLTYDEVNTFLHEFGHSLHGMFANTTYKSLSGTNVYRDFVELPSQIMENFMGEKEFLDTFAAHYQTGEKIPVELIEKIKASSHYNVGYDCVRQISFGLLDMAYHSIDSPIEGDVVKFERDALASTQVIPFVDGTMIGATFSHIFSGGYAAGYYSYKWAEVLDADAFSMFKKNGLFDENTATSFRKNILEMGGTKDPMELYVNFRGQKPTIDALMKRDGIIK